MPPQGDGTAPAAPNVLLMYVSINLGRSSKPRKSTGRRRFAAAHLVGIVVGFVVENLFGLALDPVVR